MPPFCKKAIGIFEKKSYNTLRKTEPHYYFEIFELPTVQRKSPKQKKLSTSSIPPLESMMEQSHHPKGSKKEFEKRLLKELFGILAYLVPYAKSKSEEIIEKHY